MTETSQNENYANIEPEGLFQQQTDESSIPFSIPELNPSKSIDEPVRRNTNSLESGARSYKRGPDKTSPTHAYPVSTGRDRRPPSQTTAPNQKLILPLRMTERQPKPPQSQPIRKPRTVLLANPQFQPLQQMFITTNPPDLMYSFLSVGLTPDLIRHNQTGELLPVYAETPREEC